MCKHATEPCVSYTTMELDRRHILPGKIVNTTKSIHFSYWVNSFVCWICRGVEELFTSIHFCGGSRPLDFRWRPATKLIRTFRGASHTSDRWNVQWVRTVPPMDTIITARRPPVGDCGKTVIKASLRYLYVYLENTNYH